jgi:predicted AlkP superfamily phosphohydrolase/phosphomutase
LQVYQSQDALLGRILEVLDKDTLVMLVSDHGATPGGPSFDPYAVLEKAGLSTMKEVVDETPEWVAKQSHHRAQKWFGKVRKMPDFTKSQAVPQGECYMFVNLKGRDPEGIVDLKDYEKVQQQIIDALYTYIDPRTGTRSVSLALSKKDSRILGLHGDSIPDVVYALYPWFGNQHAQQLPTAEYSVGSLKGLMAMRGPNIKKDHRLMRTVGLPDIVPTICYVMDFPVPDKCEGAVLYQVFEDPNFKSKEIKNLKDALAKMESSLSQKA